MANKYWAAAMMFGVLVVGPLAGCGGAPEASIVIGPEEDITDEGEIGQVSDPLITGCAATVVAAEAHAGIFLRSANPVTMYIQQLRWTLKNPTDTNCPVTEIGMWLRDDIYRTILDDTSLTTSLSPHKYRAIYWNIGYRSTRWWVDALFIRNNVLLKTTYMPSYFLDTGQIDH